MIFARKYISQFDQGSKFRLDFTHTEGRFIKVSNFRPEAKESVPFKPTNKKSNNKFHWGFNERIKNDKKKSKKRETHEILVARNSSF